MLPRLRKPDELESEPLAPHRRTALLAPWVPPRVTDIRQEFNGLVFSLNLRWVLEEEC